MNYLWLCFAILSMAFYGVWGALGAKSAQYLDPRAVMFFSSIGILITGIACLIALHFKMQLNSAGVSFSVATGIVNGLGTLFFIAALRFGPLVPSVMITALYPMVTILISVLLFHQSLNLKQMIGIAFSFVAIYCLSA